MPNTSLTEFYINHRCESYINLSIGTEVIRGHGGPPEKSQKGDPPPPPKKHPIAIKNSEGPPWTFGFAHVCSFDGYIFFYFGFLGMSGLAAGRLRLLPSQRPPQFYQLARPPPTILKLPQDPWSIPDDSFNNWQLEEQINSAACCQNNTTRKGHLVCNGLKG